MGKWNDKCHCELFWWFLALLRNLKVAKLHSDDYIFISRVKMPDVIATAVFIANQPFLILQSHIVIDLLCKHQKTSNPSFVRVFYHRVGLPDDQNVSNHLRPHLLGAASLKVHHSTSPLCCCSRCNVFTRARTARGSRRATATRQQHDLPIEHVNCTEIVPWRQCLADSLELSRDSVSVFDVGLQQIYLVHKGRIFFVLA